MDSNKDILDRAIGRPAMMAFMLLVGTYVTTGHNGHNHNEAEHIH